MGYRRIFLTDCTDYKRQSDVVYEFLIYFVWDISQIRSLWIPAIFEFD